MASRWYHAFIQSTTNSELIRQEALEWASRVLASAIFGALVGTAFGTAEVYAHHKTHKEMRRRTAREHIANKAQFGAKVASGSMALHALLFHNVPLTVLGTLFVGLPTYKLIEPVFRPGSKALEPPTLVVSEETEQETKLHERNKK